MSCMLIPRTCHRWHASHLSRPQAHSHNDKNSSPNSAWPLQRLLPPHIHPFSISGWATVNTSKRAASPVAHFSSSADITTTTATRVSLCNRNKNYNNEYETIALPASPSTLSTSRRQRFATNKSTSARGTIGSAPHKQQEQQHQQTKEQQKQRAQNHTPRGY